MKSTAGSHWDMKKSTKNKTPIHTSVMGALVNSYALRVPRAGDLLTASSGPRLTAATLAVRLTVPVIKVRRGLVPPSKCTLPGAKKKAGSSLTLPFALWQMV